MKKQLIALAVGFVLATLAEASLQLSRANAAVLEHMAGVGHGAIRDDR